ncbi:MAG: RNA 2'-phosphotransferase, partial [Clostridia bacterium]|nr:RNA 2'-phosphotransferase [Clostridia bacterium]
VPVDVELEALTPPDILYHGTAEKYVSSIETRGLIPKSRLYVHLSADFDTALNVGKRHGNPIIYQVDTNKMTQDGYTFYRSMNGVWLTKNVPVKYLKIIG